MAFFLLQIPSFLVSIFVKIPRPFVTRIVGIPLISFPRTQTRGRRRWLIRRRVTADGTLVCSVQLDKGFFSPAMLLLSAGMRATVESSVDATLCCVFSHAALMCNFEILSRSPEPAGDFDDVLILFYDIFWCCSFLRCFFFFVIFIQQTGDVRRCSTWTATVQPFLLHGQVGLGPSQCGPST